MVRKCKNILGKYQQPKISMIPRQDGFSTKRMIKVARWINKTDEKI